MKKDILVLVLDQQSKSVAQLGGVPSIILRIKGEGARGL